MLQIFERMDPRTIDMLKIGVFVYFAAEAVKPKPKEPVFIVNNFYTIKEVKDDK